MLFALIRQEGAGFDRSRALREQDAWDEHAEYIDALFEEGFVQLGGPLGDGSPVHRALLIVDADSEATVHARTDEDPWTPMHVLETVSVEPWELFVGELPLPTP
ncbi:MAG TPA: YciI family protein [Solirubrobacteraceae bacterium]|nr:YciI family protein [Solirubrobacteraceae bacterium]